MLGVIHKPCGHGKVCQMTILLHKPYLYCKMVHKGEGAKNVQKNSTWFMDDPPSKSIHHENTESCTFIFNEK